MSYYVFLFIVLSSVGFYNPMGVLNEQAQKALFLLSTFVGLGYALARGVKLYGVANHRFPYMPYILLLSGIGVSMVMASAFHSQSLPQTVVATLPYLMAYSTFFIFLKLDIPRERIMNTYIVLTIIAGVCYFTNLSVAPRMLFGRPLLGEDLSRGIIRIPIVFIEVFPLMLFYAINKWMDTRKKKWLVYIVFVTVMIFMSVIRQLILLSAVLGLFFYFSQATWVKKALMIAGAALIVTVVLPRIPIYNAMMELSEQQGDDNEDEEDIRIQAWRFYTYEYQTNSLTYIFGNGLPSQGKSVWGKKFDSDIDATKCFYVDVGWAGFFWLFGGVATVALLILLLSAALKRKAQDLRYTSYWLVLVTLTSIASGIILYYFQIIQVCLCLYLVYKKESETEPAEEPALQPEAPAKRGYPQLTYRAKR